MLLPEVMLVASSISMQALPVLLVIPVGQETAHL